METSIIVMVSTLLFFIIIFNLVYKVKSNEILEVIGISNKKINDMEKLNNNDMDLLLHNLKQNVIELENFNNGNNNLVEIDLEILIDNVQIILEQIRELELNIKEDYLK